MTSKCSICSRPLSPEMGKIARRKDEYMRGYGDGFKDGSATAAVEVLDLLTAHELYRYRPKAFDGFISYVRSHLAKVDGKAVPS